MAEDIVDHIGKPDKFGNFSYRPRIQPSFKNKDYEAFDTRMQTSKEIMEALRDPNLTMIGVYGMGGIGKTTLVTEVASQAKEEECFSELVMVTVSQDFDLKSIQKGIAGRLGLKLDEGDVSARANQLRHRLRQEKKILIILDDIWCELDLLQVGISFEAGDQRRCKILLVSRDQEVLYNHMGVRKNIEVKVLSNSESMSLFYKFVGDKAKADNPDFNNLANQVVRECDGLPIAIATIARSLGNKSLLVWKDTIRRLKRSPKRGMYEKVYSCIKMSYDFLESEEEKKLLLLCSLHGEDADVPVNDLMIYGIGWDLFQDVGTMEEARCSVHSLVEKLKACCLLLNDDDEDVVKVHDVVRDVMISVAKEEEHMHCLTKVAELEECLRKENFREYSKAIMLLGPDFNNQLLPRLVGPKLQLLLAFDRYEYDHLSLKTIPDDFFNEAQELKALSFNCEPLQSLPQSFCTLRHLRALRLCLGKKKDLTLIGELTNLIVLDLSRSEFNLLPEQIGKLMRLQSLNLSNCKSLRVIQPNVISSLVQLEELYMDEVYIDWEVEGCVGEGRNASLVEFKNLRNLTTLHLNVRDANVLPKDMLSENLQRYRIVIGSYNCYPDLTGSRLLYLNLSESSQLDYQYGIQKLMKNSEVMCLRGFHGIDNIVYELDTYSFSQLRELDVSSCPNLKYLLTVAMAGKLAQLETLRIRACPVMEEVIVTNEHGEGRLEKNSFPKLKYLELEDLPNLRRFCTGDCIECPSSTNMKISRNPATRTFITDSSNGASGELMGSEARQPFFNGKVAFPKLEELVFRDLDSVNYLFSFAVAKSLVTLKVLEVWSCSLMEEIVQVNEQGEEGRLDKISFPKLERINFFRLSNLKRFYGGACIEFPSLLNLPAEITDRVVLGPNLEELATTSSELIKEVCDCQSSRAPPFCNVKVVDLECFQNEPIGFSLKCIQRYQNLESLSLTGYFVDTTHHHQQLMVSSEEHERPLRRLKKLRLFQLSMLTHLYKDSEDFENSSLESLKFLDIQECNRLKSPLLSSTTSFQNLMALVVSECSVMINLLASSTAKTLVHLRLMTITECKQMIEIITDEIVDDEIAFGKLEILELSDLPNLRSFHSARNSVVRFPNLVMLVVSQCPEMRRFSSGTIDAPKLDSIISKIERIEYKWSWLYDESDFGESDLKDLWSEPQRKLWEGDINKTLEKLWEED